MNPTPVPGSLAFYLPELSGGGAERVVLTLLEAFASAGRRVSLVLGRNTGILAGMAPSQVRCIELGRASAAASIPLLARYIEADRPSILVSSLGHNNVAALLAARVWRTRTRVVVCQHNSLAAECGRGRPIRFRALPYAYKAVLPLADAVIAVSNGVAREIERICGRPAGSVQTVYNPAWSAKQAELARQPVSDRWFNSDFGDPVIVGVGRLVPQKDFGALIEAFAQCRRNGLRARLMILGEGPERPLLEARVRELGITSECRLYGFCMNPLAIMARARLLVLSSRYEGFGNVLVEAMGCGTPVVSTDCPHGPSEILDGGRYGRLVPVGDGAALARAIAEAFSVPVRRATLIDRAANFSPNESVQGYERVFRLLGQRNSIANRPG